MTPEIKVRRAKRVKKATKVIPEPRVLKAIQVLRDRRAKKATKVTPELKV